MNVERRILEAVARADLIVCAVLRRLLFAGILSLGLLAAVLAARFLAGGFDRRLIDYDRSGADITSEGPEGDFTLNYYREAD